MQTDHKKGEVSCMVYFEFGPMNKKEMIDYLGESEELEKRLPKLIEESFANIESLEESIQRNTFRRPSEDGGSSPSGFAGDKVYSILMAVYRDMKSQQREAANDVRKYQIAQDKLSYVKRCINLLSSNDKNLIIEIYVKHTPVKSYAVSHNMSASFAHRKCNLALDCLLKFYNSKNFEEIGKEKEP